MSASDSLDNLDVPTTEAIPHAAVSKDPVEKLMKDLLDEGIHPVPPSSSPRLAVGTIVAGRYRIESTLGSGGFGQVYRAHDTLLGRSVALKVLDPARAARLAAAQDAYFQEARTIARLDHPNIVPVFDAGVENEVPWMAMRLVHGRDLGTLLRDEGALSADRAATFLLQALDALEHAHHRGIVHRDIKPQNLLIETGEDGASKLWLTDFGIAKLLTGATDQPDSALVGTPWYMSPEQIAGKRIDARTDLFALGCVAFEAVSGKRAFEASNFVQALERIVHTHPPDVGALAPGVGSSYAAFVRQCLAKSPEDRYSSARQAAAALSAPEGAAVHGRTHPLGRLFRRLRRRHTPWDGQDALVVRGLRKGYRLRKMVLDGIDLTVPTGSIYALLGRNGSGKTTLIRTCVGLYRPDRGSIAVFGRDPHRDGPAVLARVGYVPEALAVHDWLRVGELLQFIARFYPRTWDTAYGYHLLERFKLPLDVKIRELSRGMQTKVSLVSVLAHRPELLVLDDPTLGLDAVVLQEFLETLQEASRREGTTMLLASHNLEDVEKLATHIGILDGGKLLLSEPLASLRERLSLVNLTFRDRVPKLGPIAHFKTLRSEGRNLTGLLLESRAETLELLGGLRPQSVETRSLSLKEIFVHLLQ